MPSRVRRNGCVRCLHCGDSFTVCTHAKIDQIVHFKYVDSIACLNKVALKRINKIANPIEKKNSVKDLYLGKANNGSQENGYLWHVFGGRREIASSRVVVLISWPGCWGHVCIYFGKFILLNTYNLCIFLYLRYTSIFKKLIWYKNICLYSHGAEFCDVLQLCFGIKSLPLLFWEMNPFTVLFQVVKKFSQKFLRKLFIIFISEGCAYFSFKEISNLFQTGNCWGNEIRLFRMLMQLDSREVVPWCASQFACSAHVLLLWALLPFPSPPMWILWSWLHSFNAVLSGNSWQYHSTYGKMICVKPIRFTLDKFGLETDS